MDFVRAREFLLGMYHDLPNVLFVGSLILGSITGYLSLVWVSLGMIANGMIVSFLQSILSFVWNTWDQTIGPAGSRTCDIFGHISPSETPAFRPIAPSHWIAASAFFAMFSIYNSIRVSLKAPAKGVSREKIDARLAVSLSVLVTGILFFALVLFRGFSGCESWLGGITGAIVGAGGAIGYWHILDACGAGTIPDILHVVQAMAPSGSDTHVPVMCTPSPTA